MTSLHIYSPCFFSDSTPANLLLNSARANGLAVELYGVGEVPDTHGGGFQLERPCEILEGEQKADIVMITDCRDVLILAPAEEIIEKFLSFKAPIVISTEKEPFPYDEFLFNHFQNPGKYVFLNTGQVIGEWGAMRDSYRYLVDHYRNVPIEQREPKGHDLPGPWWMYAKLRGQLDYAPDDEFKLFYTMSARGEGNTVDRGSRVLSVETGEWPATIHFNGDKSLVAYREMYARLFG